MPLTPKRIPLQFELTSILENPNDPLTGKKLGKALSNFSKGVLPPTLGVFTGIYPAAAAYDSAPQFGKVKGIENAINIFASFNAAGMPSVIPGFVGTPPPPIFGLQKLFDIVRKTNGTPADLARALSFAILANYTLGTSTFTPLPVFIPTWNIPVIPVAIRDEIDQGKADAKMALGAKQQEAIDDSKDYRSGPDGILGTDDDLTGPEREEFFDRMNQAE
jgi:hypothetical protein